MLFLFFVLITACDLHFLQQRALFMVKFSQVIKYYHKSNEILQQKCFSNLNILTLPFHMGYWDEIMTEAIKASRNCEDFEFDLIQLARLTSKGSKSLLEIINYEKQKLNLEFWVRMEYCEQNIMVYPIFEKMAISKNQLLEIAKFGNVSFLEVEEAVVKLRFILRNVFYSIQQKTKVLLELEKIMDKKMFVVVLDHAMSLTLHDVEKFYTCYESWRLLKLLLHIVDVEVGYKNEFTNPKYGAFFNISKLQYSNALNKTKF